MSNYHIVSQIASSSIGFNSFHSSPGSSDLIILCNNVESVVAPCDELYARSGNLGVQMKPRHWRRNISPLISASSRPPTHSLTESQWYIFANFFGSRIGTDKIKILSNKASPTECVFAGDNAGRLELPTDSFFLPQTSFQSEKMKGCGK